MTHDDDGHHAKHDTVSGCSVEPLPCRGRRALLGCAMALGMAQLLGTAEAAGQWTSAGAPASFATGKPTLVRLIHGQAPVFITKLSATSWQCLYAVCTHDVNELDLAPAILPTPSTASVTAPNSPRAGRQGSGHARAGQAAGQGSQGRGDGERRGFRLSAQPSRTAAATAPGVRC